MSSYLTRSRPQNALLRPAPPKRLTVPASDRLNTVVGRDPNNPSQNKRSQRRAPPSVGRLRNGNRTHLGDPPRESDEYPPPSYRTNVTIPENGLPQQSPLGPTLEEPKEDIFARSKQSLTRRGGWWRLVLIVLLVLLVVLGLSLGLGLGLTLKKREHRNPGASSELPGTSVASAFPVGSWLFDVVLATVKTDCTANAATWNCFPYSTYAQSPNASRFSFNWIINSTSNSGENLTIASTANTFSLDFNPTPLLLLEPGTDDERYSFSLPLPKEVQPTQALTSDNVRDICYFNQTMLTGSLYTHGNRNESPDPRTPQLWQGTVYIEQSSPSGSDTPDCYEIADWSHVTQGLVPQAMGRQCTCGYESMNATAQS